MANPIAIIDMSGKIYNSLTDTIGNTPLVRLSRFMEHFDCRAEILAKLEFFNPLSSVKDRIGLAMIDDAQKAGRITAKTVLIEPTSGNTGIALAFVAAARGLRLILTMPESMSVERRKMLTLLGAEIVLTDAAQGMKGAIQKALDLKKTVPHALILQQFENPANPDIHRSTTAQEIWRDTAGKCDAIVAGVGTGGTITGVGEFLKEKLPHLQVIAVEPEDSPVISGGTPGPHKIQGIGAGMIPKNLNLAIIDKIITISNQTAFETARWAARTEGLPAGISSGAALAAALEVGQDLDMHHKRIVVILPSSAERYLSTDLFQE